MDDTKAGRSPRDRPRQTQARPDRVPRQKRRSPERHCPRRSSLPGIPETACSARDPCPQQSASSDPSANRAGIIPRESNQPVRFHTGWVISCHCLVKLGCPLSSQKRTQGISLGAESVLRFPPAHGLARHVSAGHGGGPTSSILSSRADAKTVVFIPLLARRPRSSVG